MKINTSESKCQRGSKVRTLWQYMETRYYSTEYLSSKHCELFVTTLKNTTVMTLTGATAE